MAAPNRNRTSNTSRITPENVNLDTGIALFPASVCASLKEKNGLTKADIKQYLWDNSKVPYSKMQTWDFPDVDEIPSYADLRGDSPVPVCPKPEQLTVLCAGGIQGGHGYWMPPITQGNVTSYKIEYPSNWDELLEAAEEAFGPVPKD